MDGTIREVTPPLTAADLAPLGPAYRTVQFRSRLADDDLRRLAEFLEGHPSVRLRVYGGYDGSVTDLEFLRFFPKLRRFSVDAMYELPSLDGLRHLSPDLEELTIGWTRSKRFSLRVLERFNRLRTLYLEGQQKDIESLGRLTSLEDLTLRSITLPDLAVLEPLQRLKSLDLKLGGTRDIRHLPRIGRLEYVELWMVRGLDDVSALAEIETLEAFLLQALKNVTRLPSFARSTRLRSAALDTMKGITDLRPLAEAPGLEGLRLMSMRHLEPEALRPFVGHPTLRKGTWGLGSDRKNAEAWDLLPLGEKPYNYDACKARQTHRAGRRR